MHIGAITMHGHDHDELLVDIAYPPRMYQDSMMRQQIASACVSEVLSVHTFPCMASNSCTSVEEKTPWRHGVLKCVMQKFAVYTPHGKVVARGRLPPPRCNLYAGVALASVPAGPVAEALRTAFFESFTLYAAAVDQLADQIAAGGAAGNPVAGMKPPAQGGAAVSPRGPGAANATPPDRKLLVLLSNCAHVRSSVMPGLFTRCAACETLQVAPESVSPCPTDTLVWGCHDLFAQQIACAMLRCKCDMVHHGPSCVFRVDESAAHVALAEFAGRLKYAGLAGSQAPHRLKASHRTSAKGRLTRLPSRYRKPDAQVRRAAGGGWRGRGLPNHVPGVHRGHAGGVPPARPCTRPSV